MRAVHRLILTASGLLLATCASSCFAVTNLDRFEKSSGDSGDLSFTVSGFTSHVNEMFEYRVVDASNVLQARGIIVPLGSNGTSLFARAAVPKTGGPFNLDFYSDHDLSGGYDRDPDAGTGDHSWRQPLTPDLLDGKGGYVVKYEHNYNFSVLTNPSPPREVGQPATIRMSNLAAFLGKRVEARVAIASSGRVVALYRITTLAAPAVAVTIPGMMESGDAYLVEIYTDSGSANPGTPRAFRFPATAGVAGLDVTFDPATAPEVSDAPPP